MASTGLRGPFVLITPTIAEAITKTSPGAYALGWVDENRTFSIHYVGRDDDDVNRRLRDWGISPNDLHLAYAAHLGVGGLRPYGPLWKGIDFVLSENVAGTTAP